MRLPTRGLMVGFSRATAGIADLQNYLRPGVDKVMHVLPTCSNMNRPDKHYIPIELSHMIKWCETCAQGGNRVVVPNFCPSCEEVIDPTLGMDEVTTRNTLMSRVGYCRHLNAAMRRTRCGNFDRILITELERFIRVQERRHPQSRWARRMIHRLGNEFQRRWP